MIFELVVLEPIESNEASERLISVVTLASNVSNRVVTLSILVSNLLKRIFEVFDKSYIVSLLISPTIVPVTVMKLETIFMLLPDLAVILLTDKSFVFTFSLNKSNSLDKS